MAFSSARITRLGVSGFPRQKYGSFAGKGATDAGAAPQYVTMIKLNKMMSP